MSHTADAPCAGLCARQSDAMDRRSFLSVAALAMTRSTWRRCDASSSRDSASGGTGARYVR